MKPKSSNQVTGKTGERMAEDFLKKQGYFILERNVRSPFGEIDLVAKHQKTLVFVEVKTRRSTDFGFPEESLTAHKKHRLGRLASWYLMNRSYPDCPVRFDVLAIQLEGGQAEIRVIQNAFELSS
jgi:putative endonuclease